MKKTIYIFLILFFCIVYRTNFIDTFNTAYHHYQQDSEDLAMGKAVIAAYKEKGINLPDDWRGLKRARNPKTEDTQPYQSTSLLRKSSTPTENINIEPYSSQLGWQGYLYTYSGKLIPYKQIPSLFRTINCLLLSIVLVSICLLLARKYNNLVAFCWGWVFLFSPWIVNFAPNLYWVEFTWFLPMLVGLAFTFHYNQKRYYFFAFLALLIKSACGYEYISTILIGLLLFPCVDLFVALCKRNTNRIYLLRKIIILGISGLTAFLITLLLHAFFRGDGNILNGLSNIWHQDVLRRTLLGTIDNTDFPEVYTKSIEAKIIDVIKMYLDFYNNAYHSDIIMGIDGRWFICISVLSALLIGKRILLKEFNQTENYTYLGLLIISFCASLSWFTLAKSHSFIHTHMNYVMWYFGYIQTCLFIIIDSLINYTKQYIIKKED